MKKYLISAIVASFAFAANAQTINSLTPGGAVSGTDTFPAYQGSNPATGVTAAQVKTFMNAASLSGGSTITPAFAGNSSSVNLTPLSNALSFTTPSNMPVQATHFLGYGNTYEDQNQLILSNNSIGSLHQNMFELRQQNVNAFSTVTFQSPNQNSAITADIFEHGAIGYVAPYNNFTGAMIWEASNLPNYLTTATCSTTISSTTLTCTGNAGVNTFVVTGPGQTYATVVSGGGTTSITMSVAAQSTTTNQTYYFGGVSHAPPPEIDIFQTGAVDATNGVTQATCTVTATSTAMTCTGNGGTNGQYVWGPGVTYETKVSSGGGTTSITLSQAANTSYSGALYSFNTSPTVLQRRVFDCTPLGTCNLRDFLNGIVLAVDRYHDRIGINTATPAFTLDVNGPAQLNGALNFAGGGSVTGGGGLPLSLVGSNHIVQVTDNNNGGAIIKVLNSSAGNVAQAALNLSTGTANSSMALALLDQAGAPIVLWNVGSAVSNTLFRGGTGQFLFQSSGGTTDFAINPGSGITTVSGVAIGGPTGGVKGAGTLNIAGAYYSNNTIGVTCSGSPTASFASTLGIVTHC